MKVSSALIEASLHEPEKALRMVNVFSRSTLAPPPSVLGPGTWIFGAGMALGRRVLQSNPQVNIFHRGFVACDSYTGGEQAMAQVCCPVLFLLGALDQNDLAQSRAEPDRRRTPDRPACASRPPARRPPPNDRSPRPDAGRAAWVFGVLRFLNEIGL